MSGLAAMATYAWAATEFDRETATGYEKTTRIGGHKAIEKYDRSRKSAEVSVLVGDRFIVAAQGSGVDADVLRDAVQKVDLGRGFSRLSANLSGGAVAILRCMRSPTCGRGLKLVVRRELR